MEKDITTLLLSHFPTDDSVVLTYDEFLEKDSVCYIECIFDWDRDFHTLMERAYRLISVPWPEIRWREMANLGGGGEGRMIPQFINRKTFLHVFPSLIHLVYMCPSSYEEEAFACFDLLLNFISSRLILHSITDERKWQFEFYDSLHEDVVRLVYVALKKVAKIDPILAWEAIYSYWYKGFLPLVRRSRCGISEMETEITPLLLAHFPVDSFATLTYDDFIHEGGGCFYESEDDAKNAYRLVSVPWPEINWVEVANIGSSGWMSPSFMNRKIFIYTFPSLLDFIYRSFSLSKEDASSHSRLMIDSFIGSCLTLHDGQDKKWQFEFFDSLHEDVARLIRFILYKSCDYNASLVTKAVDDYWHKVCL
ncbi:MAG: hypothetical protein LBP86_04880 [Azoarcus sp.]|jgi:hypothetical protein|nr:hypothetical protein [Azoarcus sp.]